MATITIYDSFILDNLGRRLDGGTSPAEPAATITGSGSPSTAAAGVTKSVPASTRVRIYDRTDDGGFDILRVTAAADLTLWIKIGTSATDNLIWFPIPIKAANGPFRLTSDDSWTNASVATGAGDSGDAPLGASDSGRLAAKVWAIEAQNYGAADTTLVYDRLN